MLTVVKIPVKRVAVLIGKNGRVKKDIEKATRSKIKVSKTEDCVEINGDALSVIIAENIIKAVGRGFSPEKAKLLLDETNTLAVLNISEDKKKLARIKSRLIGTAGKARRNMERLTGTYISVYGKTISVIGHHENVDKLCVGLEKLIKGTSHRFVYQYLEREFSRMRKNK